MRKFFRVPRGAGVLVLAAALAAVLPVFTASAQMPGMPAAAAGASAPSVMTVQDALARQGFPLKVDGVLGPATREAIKAFQLQHHLPVTGDADAATLAKLGVQDAGHAAHSRSAMSHGAHGRPAPQRGGMMQGGMKPDRMMPGRMMQGGMMEHCGDMHQQMRQMMAQMQEMMKSMPGQMPAPKPN